MQSGNYPIPRCVLAQTFLDNINNNRSGSESDRDSYQSSSEDDRNSDLDEKHQESVNMIQAGHRDHTAARLFDALPIPGISSNATHLRKNQVGDQHHHQHHQHQQHSYQYLQQQPQPQQQQQHRRQQEHHSSSSFQHPSLQHKHQHQPQHRQLQQRYDRHLSCSSGAFDHPQQQQQQHQQQHHHPSQRHRQAEMTRLEALFPPLHDTVETVPTPEPVPSSLSITTAGRPTREPRLPPLIIPNKDNNNNSHALVHTQDKNRISPVDASGSPDSPSGLAIHLYVHHHHHHHSQETVTSQSTPMVLLSPLTLPMSTTSLPLEQASKVSSPPPPPPAPVVAQTPLVSPRPQPALLPSLIIPTSPVHTHLSNTSTTSSVPPSSISPNETDTLARELPWFKHPNSLANSSSLSSRPPALRRHRHRPQLPDPTLASQLLSTISSKDLARLYVHAAHHLHSHQPIRRYVMMKMMMTQAELAQYGRLRAEMPRAPSPSTGAKPRRTGFGSVANTGLAAKPKKPSKLITVMTLPTSGSGTGSRWMPMAVPSMPASAVVQPPIAPSSSSSLSLMSVRQSLLGTKSLSSLTSLLSSSSPSSQKRPLARQKLPSWHNLEYSLPTSSSSSSSSSLKTESLNDSSRRLEELELGQPRQPRQLRRSLSSHGSEKDRCTTLAITTDEDDDQEDDEEDEEEEEEEVDSYWTLLRRKNNRSRRRLVRTVDPSSMPLMALAGKEDPRSLDRISLLNHQQHHHHLQQHQLPPASYPPHSKQHRQQQQQHISLQPLHHPPPSIYGEAISTSTSLHSLSTSHSNNNSLYRPLETTTDATSNTLHSGRPKADRRGSSESYGLSGLLMVTLFLGFLYLIERTNQFYNLQSALLSIIL